MIAPPGRFRVEVAEVLALPLFRALDLARSAGHPLEEAAALDGIGHCLEQQGNRASAVRSWQLAHRILVELHHPRAEVVGARLTLNQTR